MLARVRLTVLDRPGALGRVASAIGAAGGDIAKVDVLESRAGRALDDVLVEVRDTDHLDRVTAALSALPGVDVSGSQYPAPPVTGHSELELVQQALANPDRALHTLVDGAPAAVGADWAALLEFGPDGGQSGVLAVSLGGPAPEAVAVRAPLRLATVRLGARSGGEAPPAALVPLGPTLGLVLVREGGVGFHGSELWRLGALGSIVGEAVRGRTPPEAATTPR